MKIHLSENQDLLTYIKKLKKHLTTEDTLSAKEFSISKINICNSLLYSANGKL